MRPTRFGSALSAVALATMLGGCAASQTGPGSASAASGKVGLATRALVALNGGDTATAISFAEQAVEKSPNDAAFRGLLGTAYFAAGRFASAEAAFRDSLSLASNQPSIVLKLALTQIAQGKNGEAVALLAAAQGLLDVSDVGLALALAGQPQQAVSILDPAARSRGADARLRQNLALAHALAGDWTAARTIAAQDLPANLVESRVKEWMTLASPARPADQVAALTGVVPAAVDPGQPVRLALHRTDTRQAQAAPAALPPKPREPIIAHLPRPAPSQPAPVAVASQPALAVASAPGPELYYLASPPVIDVSPAQQEPLAAAHPEPQPAFVAAEPSPKTVRAAPAPAAKAAATRVAKLVQKRPAMLQLRSGNSTAVVQLGAYGSPQRVAAAWSEAARRFAVLRAYSPMSAQFNSARGRVYRLSVRGFGNSREAIALCESLRRAGGSCFVRSVAGDAPVRLAAR